MNLAIETADTRRDAFAIAGEKRGLLPVLIEKEFGVCWTLERLFALPEFRGHCCSRAAPVCLKSTA